MKDESKKVRTTKEQKWRRGFANRSEFVSTCVGQFIETANRREAYYVMAWGVRDWGGRFTYWRRAAVHPSSSVPISRVKHNMEPNRPAGAIKSKWELGSQWVFLIDSLLTDSSKWSCWFGWSLEFPIWVSISKTLESKSHRPRQDTNSTTNLWGIAMTRKEKGVIASRDVCEMRYLCVSGGKSFLKFVTDALCLHKLPL